MKPTAKPKDPDDLCTRQSVPAVRNGSAPTHGVEGRKRELHDAIAAARSNVLGGGRRNN